MPAKKLNSYSVLCYHLMGEIYEEMSGHLDQVLGRGRRQVRCMLD